MSTKLSDTFKCTVSIVMNINFDTVESVISAVFAHTAYVQRPFLLRLGLIKSAIQNFLSPMKTLHKESRTMPQRTEQSEKRKIYGAEMNTCLTHRIPF